MVIKLTVYLTVLTVYLTVLTVYLTVYLFAFVLVLIRFKIQLAKKYFRFQFFQIFSNLCASILLCTFKFVCIKNTHINTQLIPKFLTHLRSPSLPPSQILCIMLRKFASVEEYFDWMFFLEFLMRIFFYKFLFLVFQYCAGRLD